MKRKFPKFKDITPKLLYHGMKKSYKNAEDYYYEAELLHQMRRYGHSIGLSTLGIEELGKSMGYLVLIGEKIPFGKQNTNSKFNPDEIIKLIHSGHREKQYFSSIYAFSTHIALYDLLILSNEIYNEEIENISIQTIFKGISEIQKKARRKSKNIKKWKKDMEFIENLQNKKMIGMYVDITPEPITLSFPGKIKAKESKKALAILDNYLGLLHYISDIIWEDNFYQLMEINKYPIFGDT